MAQLRKLLKFEEILYAANAEFDSEFKDAALDTLTLAFDGAYSGTTPVNLAEDAPWSLLSRLQLEHNGARIDMSPEMLYHISALLNGGYNQKLAQVVASPGNFSARMTIPLGSLVKDGGLDATQKDVSWKGTFRPPSYYSGTAPGAITGTLRPGADVPKRAPQGGYRDPEWTEEIIKVESASLTNSKKIEFNSPYFVPMLVLIAYDASAGFGTDSKARTDGLARRVTVDLFGVGGAPERIVDNVTWGMLRDLTCKKFGFSDDDQASSVGVVAIPLVDPSRDVNPWLGVRPGVHLTITIDSQSTVEGGYTAVAGGPATGDKIVVGVPKFYVAKKASEAAARTDTVGGVEAAQVGSRRAFVRS